MQEPKFKKNDYVRDKDGRRGKIWRISHHESGYIYCYITKYGNVCSKEESLVLADKLKIIKIGDDVRVEDSDTVSKVIMITVDEDGDLYHLENGMIKRFKQIS